MKRTIVKMTAGGGLVALLTVLALAGAPASLAALAPPVPGATYHGIASDYGVVTFTVSADGTSLASYSISAHGTTSTKYQTCSFQSIGGDGWSTPITHDSFNYSPDTSVAFTGTFNGRRSASGTFELSKASTPGSLACSTGPVTWTATVTSTGSRGGGGGGATGNGGGTNGNGGGSGATHVATVVIFHRLSSTRIGGSLRSSGKGCASSRTLILWRGSRRIATTRSKANGTYSFTRSRTVRGRTVRVQVTQRTIAGFVCEPAMSNGVRA